MKMTTTHSPALTWAFQQPMGFGAVGPVDCLPAKYPLTNAPFERTRWATARTDSVDQVLNTWTEQPDLIRIFEDPKLGRGELVMLRKDRFDDLVELFNKLVEGQAGILVQVEGLAQLEVALKSAVERSSKDPLLQSLVTLVGSFVGSIQSSIVLVNKPSATGGPVADEETLDFLRQEEAMEEEVDEPPERSSRAE